jgi:hypothetical protein
MEPLVVVVAILAPIAVVCAIVALIIWSRERRERLDDAGAGDPMRTNYGRRLRRR